MQRHGFVTTSTTWRWVGHLHVPTSFQEQSPRCSLNVRQDRHQERLDAVENRKSSIRPDSWVFDSAVLSIIQTDLSRLFTIDREFMVFWAMVRYSLFGRNKSFVEMYCLNIAQRTAGNGCRMTSNLIYFTHKFTDDVLGRIRYSQSRCHAR